MKGDRALGVSGKRITLQEISAAISPRADILTRVLPLTSIADKCRLEPSHLEVRGQLGTVLHFTSLGLAALVTDTGVRWPKITQKLLAAVPLKLDDVPIELDIDLR